MALGKKGSGVDPLIAESVLCVAIDHNEVVGEYFAAAPEEQMTVANAFSKNPKRYSFENAYTEDSSAFNLLDASSAKQAAYLPGDAIKTFAASSSATILSPVLTGFGAAIGSNECWQLNPVRFEYPQEAADCIRKSVDLESVCQEVDGYLSVAPFAQNVLVARSPSVTSTASASELLAVEVELEEFDFATGGSVTLETPFPAYFPSTAFSNSSSSGSACSGALLRLEYVISHNGSGHLEQIKARITIGNVSTPVNSTQTLVDIVQTFSVRFQSVSALPSDVVALSNGNVQTYQRSGNPGYLMHYPLRVGVLAANTEDAALANVHVISEMTGGLQVPGLGDCVAESMFDPQTVGFGEDSQTSCSLSLTADEFEAFCKRPDTLVNTLRVNFTHVAVFGNSDPFLSAEWLAVDYDAPVKNSATFVAAQNAGTVELSCQDVITSVNFEFLVAGVGSVNNPQHKIIAARAFHGKDTWKFWKPGSSRESQEAKTQLFLLHTRINYIYVRNTELEQLIPPAPPIWFSIPSDVFYPFILNDAASGMRSPSLFLLAIWIASAIYQL